MMHQRVPFGFDDYMPRTCPRDDRALHEVKRCLRICRAIRVAVRDEQPAPGDVGHNWFTQWQPWCEADDAKHAWVIGQPCCRAATH